MTTLEIQSKENTEQFIIEAEAALSKSIWPGFEQVQYQTFERVLEGFLNHRVGEEHFSSVSGYGHDDLGREVTDHVFAHAFQAEAALVRTQLVSGTHALSVGLNGCLRNGDRMVCVTGKPYDTLEEVIGIRGSHPRSIRGQGIDYQEISVFDGDWKIRGEWSSQEQALLKQATMVYIQRSRGYSIRPSLSLETIAWIVREAKALNPEVIVMVDNCYGEFVEADEPTSVGADLIAGSLIKNPGGGIVPTGGYIAGREKLVEACAAVLTCPGIGADGGYTFNLTRTILHGLYQAPMVVKEALKGMSLAAYLMAQAGYWVDPVWNGHRSDIVQAIGVGSPEKLQAFCKAVQSVSPVNSHLTPVPSHVPGYENQVLMAGGTFIDGSSIELSADGPLREPYTVFFQGGLTYAHARLALQKILASFGN